MSQLESCSELSQKLELINPSHIITRPLMVRMLPPPAWKLSYQIILTDDYQPRLTCEVGGRAGVYKANVSTEGLECQQL